jgi:hypothetical protein
MGSVDENWLRNITAAISSSVRSWNPGSPSSSSSQSCYIFFRGFSLSRGTQHSLKVLLLLNPMRLSTANRFLFSFFIFWSGLSDIRINCNRVSEGFLYRINLLTERRIQKQLWNTEYAGCVRNKSWSILRCSAAQTDGKCKTPQLGQPLDGSDIQTSEYTDSLPFRRNVRIRLQVAMQQACRPTKKSICIRNWHLWVLDKIKLSL